MQGDKNKVVSACAANIWVGWCFEPFVTSQMAELQSRESPRLESSSFHRREDRDSNRHDSRNLERNRKTFRLDGTLKLSPSAPRPHQQSRPALFFFLFFFSNDCPAFAAPYVIGIYSPHCINPSAEKEDREEMRSVSVYVCEGGAFLITIIATIQLVSEQLRAVMKRAPVWRERSGEQLVLVSSSSAGWRLICRLVGRWDSNPSPPPADPGAGDSKMFFFVFLFFVWRVSTWTRLKVSFDGFGVLQASVCQCSDRKKRF